MLEDKVIVAYIAKGMKNEYIRLSKKNCLVTKNEAPILDDIQIPDTSGYDNVELRVQLQEVLDKLTDLQKQIVYEVILKDRKEKDVAAELNVSRQAVNNAKRQALRNLKKALCLE